MVPKVPYKLREEEECEECEWPPSTLILPVFSSKLVLGRRGHFIGKGMLQGRYQPWLGQLHFVIISVATGKEHFTPFNFNYDDDDDDEDDVELEPIVEEKFEKFEWDSDNDNVLEPGIYDIV
uniref:Uncharacterized protein n=1 Tax=Oryza barthii TaxID=65489 RepID=A0A0D3GN69_9ORYZ